MAAMNFTPAGLEFEDDEFDEDGFLFDTDIPNIEPDVTYTSTETRKWPSGKFEEPSPPKLTSHNVLLNHNSSSLHQTPRQKRNCSAAPGNISHNGATLPLDDFRNAVMMGKLDQIQSIINQGTPVDTILRAGWSALMYAGNWTNFASLELLLENGANPNFHIDHYTVLMATCAASQKKEEDLIKCVALLLKKGANINDFDRFHMSALMYAARDGKTQLVQQLMKSGANIDKQDNRGYSALTWAVMKGHIRTVQVLLQNGANAQIMTTDGSQPSDIALAHGHQKIINILHSFENGAGASHLTLIPEDAGTAGVDSNNLTNNRLNITVGDQYGELELFLSGLGLSDLISTFTKSHVNFTDFLRMNDSDLQKIGVTSMGIRKKILDAIQSTHKTKWEASSLNCIQYNKQLTCPESVAILTNISKHSGYISSTVGFVTDQIQAHPNILRTRTEDQSLDELLVKTEESLNNVRILYTELSILYSHISKMQSKENVHPPDLILKRKKVKKTGRKTLAGLLFGLTVIGVILWNKDEFMGTVTKIFPQITR